MFDKDLFEANKLEREFAAKLLQPGVVKVEFGDTDERDIRITTKGGKQRTYEVKDNNRADKSVCFEYEYKNRPSGVVNSKADYIVYYFDNKFHRQERGKLINELMVVNKYSTIGGDNDNSKLWIVDKDIAKLLFQNEL